MSGHSQLSLFRISEIQGDEGSNSFKDRTNESFLTPFISHQDSLPDHKQVIVNILFDQLSLLFQCGNNICGSYILMVRQNDRMRECQCLFFTIPTTRTCSISTCWWRGWMFSSAVSTASDTPKCSPPVCVFCCSG